MADTYLLIPLLISFLISLFFIPYWISKGRQVGLVWKDMNKFSEKYVVGSGGIIVVLAFVTGVLAFIAYRIFFVNTEKFLIEILTLLFVIFFLSGIGFIDDLFGWKKGGLKIKNRIILTALAAIPLMVINAGKSQVSLPIFGLMDLGLIYPLIIIPLGIVGATTTFNFLAGFNGMEAGLGIIVLSGLGIVSFYTGSSWLAIIAFCMVAALLGFLIYNLCPAKIFPGDSLTYAVGGLIAVIAVLGNFEKVAVFFFIPYILETFLKLRGRLQRYSFGKPDKDGYLDLRYDRIYSLNHLAMLWMKKSGIRPTEMKVVLSIWLFQALIVVLGLVIFRGGIFG